MQRDAAPLPGPRRRAPAPAAQRRGAAPPRAEHPRRAPSDARALLRLRPRQRPPPASQQLVEQLELTLGAGAPRRRRRMPRDGRGEHL
jgi:hypothetical protein